MHGMMRRLAMEDYKYKLQYVDGGVVVNYEFDANVDVYQLEDNLKRFLKACSWLPETLDKIFVDNRKLENEDKIINMAHEIVDKKIPVRELEQESEWKEIKILAENYIVKNRLMFGSGAETPDDKYREFLRFYTELEVKYEDRTEFIFDDCEKELFKKCMGLKKI